MYTYVYIYINIYIYITIKMYTYIYIYINIPPCIIYGRRVLQSRLVCVPFLQLGGHSTNLTENERRARDVEMGYAGECRRVMQ